jgi:hypothetical protein
VSLVARGLGSSALVTGGLGETTGEPSSGVVGTVNGVGAVAGFGLPGSLAAERQSISGGAVGPAYYHPAWRDPRPVKAGIAGVVARAGIGAPTSAAGARSRAIPLAATAGIAAPTSKAGARGALLSIGASGAVARPVARAGAVSMVLRLAAKAAVGEVRSFAEDEEALIVALLMAA